MAGQREAGVVALTFEEAVPLGQAYAAQVAEACGVRAIAIKGPVLALQGLRPDRLSGDVDVWVDPAQIERYFVELRGLGWEVVAQEHASRLLPLHASVATHKLWPVQLDVHSYFPGFLAPPQAVFEVLWERHDSVRLAGTNVPCTDLIGSAAVYTLNLLRDGEERGVELEDLVALLQTWHPADLDRLGELASRTGALTTMEPVLSSLDVRVAVHGSFEETEDLRLWQLRGEAGQVSGVAQFIELRSTPWFRWPGVLWRNLVLTPDELRALAPDVANRSFGLTRVRLSRLGRAVRDLPRALRASRR